MATLLLIRHGRTRANVDGVLAGRSAGVPLDDAGLLQVRALAERLRQVPLAAVVHSPLERCVQTARELVDGRPDVALHPDDRLVECDYGRWTGGRLEDLARDPLWATIMDRPSEVTFPEGESMAAMAARAVACADEWAARAGPDAVVVLVSHGDVLKALISHALDQPFDSFQRIAVGPASVSVVRTGPPRPMVLRMNDSGPQLPIATAPLDPVVGGGVP